MLAHRDSRFHIMPSKTPDGNLESAKILQIQQSHVGWAEAQTNETHLAATTEVVLFAAGWIFISNCRITVYQAYQGRISAHFDVHLGFDPG